MKPVTSYRREILLVLLVKLILLGLLWALFFRRPHQAEAIDTAGHLLPSGASQEGGHHG